MQKSTTLFDLRDSAFVLAVAMVISWLVCPWILNQVLNSGGIGLLEMTTRALLVDFALNLTVELTLVGLFWLTWGKQTSINPASKRLVASLIFLEIAFHSIWFTVTLILSLNPRTFTTQLMYAPADWRSSTAIFVSALYACGFGILFVCMAVLQRISSARQVRRATGVKLARVSAEPKDGA